ncbi:uncharacterized protein [Euwallacea similis]|uniref:uncharacterized protein n=1 Tax=Euwallacea similis TaxID=1736056 RepID=UPI00344BAE16
MRNFSICTLMVLLCVAFVMSKPSPKENGEAVELVPAPEEVENIDASSSTKTKRGAYGGIGYGFGGYYPYSFGHYPYGHYGTGYYGHYPYVSLGYGLHHGYGWYW